MSNGQVKSPLFFEKMASVSMRAVLGGRSLLHASTTGSRTSQQQQNSRSHGACDGLFPQGRRKPPLMVRILKSENLLTITPTTISYLSEEGDHVPAYLLKPNNLKAPVRRILCLHSTTPLGAAEPAGLGHHEDPPLPSRPTRIRPRLRSCLRRIPPTAFVVDHSR